MLGVYCNKLGEDNDDLVKEVVVGRLKKGLDERVGEKGRLRVRDNVIVLSRVFFFVI